MDNAKARCWYQHRVPLILSADNKKLDEVIQSVVLFAVAALQVLKGQLKSAWFSTPKEAKVDFSMVDIAFWQETEASFRILLDALIPDPERLQPATRQALKCWETELHLYLLNIFDREIFADPEAPDDILLRQITARRHFEKEYYKLKSRKALLELATDRKESENAK